jgi:hypothetical protein
MLSIHLGIRRGLCVIIGSAELSFPCTRILREHILSECFLSADLRKERIY